MSRSSTSEFRPSNGEAGGGAGAIGITRLEPESQPFPDRSYPSPRAETFISGPLEQGIQGFDPVGGALTWKGTPNTVLSALTLSTSVVNADPLTGVDQQFLAALNHGGLCCASQPDSPIWKNESAILAVNTGKMVDLLGKVGRITLNCLRLNHRCLSSTNSFRGFNSGMDRLTFYRVR